MIRVANTEEPKLLFTGRVRNTGTKTLRNVQVIVDYLDSMKSEVSSGSATLPVNPLYPGGESGFRILSHDHPAISRFTIRFQAMKDGMIPFIDGRKK